MLSVSCRKFQGLGKKTLSISEKKLSFLKKLRYEDFDENFGVSAESNAQSNRRAS